MKKDIWEKLEENNPEKLKKPFISKGFQEYRNEMLRIIKPLNFSEKFNLIKQTDRELLKKLNRYTGTKAVHILEYISKIPSRKKELTLTDECVLALRSLMLIWARNDYYNERRKQRIKIVK
jgi:hypothetical protein